MHTVRQDRAGEDEVVLAVLLVAVRQWHHARRGPGPDAATRAHTHTQAISRAHAGYFVAGY